MTQFEQAQQQVREGSLQAPIVSTAQGEVNYFGYQLAVHHFNLKLMSKGMSCRGITFTQIKNYYGLKGRSAKDVLDQFQVIMNAYQSRAAEPVAAS